MRSELDGVLWEQRDQRPSCQDEPEGPREAGKDHNDRVSL